MLFEYEQHNVPDFMELEIRENLSLPLHIHKSFEINYVISGELKMRVEDKEYILYPGMSILIFPKQVHSFSSVFCKHLHCTFSTKLVNTFSSQYSNLIPQNNTFKLDEYLSNSLLTMSRNSSDIQKKGVLYSICHQFNQQATYTKTSQSNRNLTYKIFSFVDNNLTNDCTLSALSKELGYDSSYISRYFKKNIGITFNSYVNHCRLTLACHYLENTDFPIVQCALESGYDTLRNFNRIFKLTYGITPVEYRKTLLKNKNQDN